MLNFKDLCEKFENQIIKSYENGVTLEEAERLAAEFLYAPLRASAELKTADLSSRMRKSGVKAVKAAVYTQACAGADKKPTESALEHLINMNNLVSSEQDELDVAEADRAELERYYNVFREAHIYFRGTAKGKFE